MSEFRCIAEGFYAAPQIAAADIPAAKALGVTTIINNRPDGEAPDQPDGAEIADAARAAGLAYHAIPVTAAGFGMPQVEAMRAALASADGPVLAFCRSGTRSTLLRSLAEAAAGRDPETIAAEAAQGGYDCSPVRAAMDMLAAGSGREA